MGEPRVINTDKAIASTNQKIPQAIQPRKHCAEGLYSVTSWSNKKNIEVAIVQ
ncbi:hypothetical protein [Nostoc sp.]|uniref:hypothetical protein n=1 Tax=Nostoc sp. TaxID=1180 RepID=UPI002FFCD2CD